uniref:Uncharacterized protein n=1 Tax=Arundo donax TaxID=35708 RepID=A0A0A9AZP1_ARUDO
MPRKGRPHQLRPRLLPDDTEVPTIWSPRRR